MRYFAALVLAGAAILTSVADAAAQQWGRPSFPSRGACFYEDINFGGRFFCYAVGADAPAVPRGTNDEISSIRVFGSVEVTVYRDPNFRGAARRLTSSISSLESAGWNDRISSFRIDRRSSGGGWGGAYGGGNWGGGADSGYNSGWGGAYGGGSHGGGNAGSGSRWTYQQAQEIVRRAYRSTLGRDPDPAAQPWVHEVMKNNLSQRQLEAELRKSDEYRRKRG